MKSNIQRIGIFIVLILFLISFNIRVDGVSSLPESSYNFYVYDEGNIIDKNTEDYIINVNRELYRKTGVQIVVAAVNSLDSMDINSYATALFEEWQIGGKGKDNGLLILISLEDRELWIETGYELEGAITAGRAKRIIDNSILPSFSEGDYNTGIIQGFNDILDYVEEEYEINLAAREGIPSDYVEDDEDTPPVFLIILIIIFLIIDFTIFKGWLTLSILRGFGGRGGPRGGGGFGGGGFGSGGFGGGSSSGRTTGGGGRSGGGGAGGKW